MPSFEIYDHLLAPIMEKLEADPRFEGVKVFYDRQDDEIVEPSLMPAINYFLQPDWEDITRGSNTASLQDRKLTVNIGFGIWAFDINKAKLEQALFHIAGNLIDWLRENTEFDRTNGVSLSGSLRWTPVAAFGKDNNLIGTQRIVATFELYSGAGV